MKTRKLLYGAMLALLTFNISCRNDDNPTIETQPVQKGPYEKGIIVSNEGNFGQPNSSVSFISKDFNTIENDVFATNNAGSVLGDVLQSIGFAGDYAYLVMNNSNKIEIVNRYTFKKTGTVTEQISQPRFIAFAHNNYYVTNSSGSSKFVTVYNTATNAFVKKIDLTNTGERIVEASGKIVVQNAAFGSGNKFTFINPTTNTVESVLRIPSGAIQSTISNDGNVYSIASTSTDSYIYKIAPSGSITSTLTLTGIARGKNLQIDGGKYIFTSGGKVYSIDMNTTTVPTTPIITVADVPFSSMYGFHVLDGKIFISNANGFTANSTVEIYSATGLLVKTITAQRGTNGFYKN